MQSLLRGVVLALLWVVLPAHASRGIIYQPQLRDMSITDARWEQIVTRVKQDGFDTLIVQWTRYGDAFGTARDADWLAARLIRAHDAGLRLVLGLYSDPAFFSRQTQNAGELARYLAHQEYLDLDQAKVWLARLGKGRISGWYLPAEVDDANWRQPDRQQLLARYLAVSARSLRSQRDVPVYISTFFTGKMSPEAYSELVRLIARQQVQPMVQDGRGTGVLNDVERDLYLSVLMPCQGRVAGIVHELFVQRPDAKAFRADALAPERQQALLATPDPCGSQRWFFSLRYLTAMQDMR